MRLALVLALAGSFVGCQSFRDRIGHCDDSEFRRDVSPDGKHDAVLFVRDCDEKIYTTSVSIVAHGAVVEGKGNAFEGSADVPLMLFVPTWTSATELTITAPASVAGNHWSTSVDGVKITPDKR